MSIVNRSELADIFGVTPPTVDAWLNAGMPFESRPGKDGSRGWKLDAGKALNWHRTRERENALGEVARVDEQEAKRRKLVAEAALVELELALRQGGVAVIADISKEWSRWVTGCRAKLLSIPSKIGPMVAVEPDVLACQSLLTGAIHEALEELSGQGDYTPASDGDVASGDPGGSEDPRAAAETHG